MAEPIQHQAMNERHLLVRYQVPVVITAYKYLKGVYNGLNMRLLYVAAHHSGRMIGAWYIFTAGVHIQCDIMRPKQNTTKPKKNMLLAHKYTRIISALILGQN